MTPFGAVEDVLEKEANQSVDWESGRRQLELHKGRLGMLLRREKLAASALLFASRILTFLIFITLLLRLLWFVPLPELSSPLSPTPTTPFSTYFRAMNGEVDLYSTSVYPTTPQTQRAILRHQFPTDCSRARFLVFEMWDHGLGSGLLGATTALALAIASSRVLVIAEPAGGWHLARGCATPGFGCFFQPEAGCRPSARQLNASVLADGSAGYAPRSDARTLVLRSDRPYLGPARRNLSSVLAEAHRRLGLPRPLARANRAGGYPAVRAWHTQATLYLTRLNARMQRKVARGLDGCSGGDADSLRRRTLGVPLRGSDKCFRRGGHGEMGCVGPERVVRALGHMRATHPWLEAALVTSEDGRLARKVEGAIGGKWIVRKNNRDAQQGSGSAAVWKRMGGKGFRMTESMLVTLACQAMPRFHVLTIRSNFHSLIDMMAKTVPGKPAHFSYSIGDPHFPA